jgi:hypothetical protein
VPARGARDPAQRTRYPHLVEGVTERERRIAEFLARLAIAERIARGELPVRRATIDTANERLVPAPYPCAPLPTPDAAPRRTLQRAIAPSQHGSSMTLTVLPSTETSTLNVTGCRHAQNNTAQQSHTKTQRINSGQTLKFPSVIYTHATKDSKLCIE